MPGLRPCRHPMNARSAPDPVGCRERAPALDALRGFALLGILLVNLRLFSGPCALAPGLAGDQPWWDRLATGRGDRAGRGPLLSPVLLPARLRLHRRLPPRPGARGVLHRPPPAAQPPRCSPSAPYMPRCCSPATFSASYAVLGLALLAAVHWRRPALLALAGWLLGRSVRWSTAASPPRSQRWRTPTRGWRDLAADAAVYARRQVSARSPRCGWMTGRCRCCCCR